MEKGLFRQVQLAQLGILDELDHFCAEYGLIYYIVGGTLLGAVRHKGFIPWDVDIDVVMPRKDYDIFNELYSRQTKSRYVLHNYKNTKGFTRPHALLCLKGTKLITRYDKFNPQSPNYGIYIDIFPLENTPDDVTLRRKHERKIRFWKMLQHNKISYSYTGNSIKQFVHRLIRIMLSPLSLEWINERFDKSTSKYNNLNTVEIGAVGSGRFPYDRESMNREVFGNPVKLLFEGKYVSAPYKYEDWLKRMYGDYMRFPPEQEQEEGYSFIESVEF